MVFDCPGLNAPFRVRQDRFNKVIEDINSSYLVTVPHILC